LRKYFLCLIIILTGVMAVLLAAQEPLIGDVSDGSRAKFVHVIKLLDADSSLIWLSDQPLMPFSTKITCGACHTYAKINRGWHFNEGDSGAVSGRPGQPWIYVDQLSSTQIPVSLREWPGTYKPQDIGMSNLAFIGTFGRQMAGGGPGENENLRSLDNLFRWEISGDLEINCLSCHDAEFAHNQAEYAAQTARENFRWAAAASSAFAFVRGSAKDMPVKYDLYAGTAPSETQAMAPQIIYDQSRFNYKHEVQFDITTNIPDQNCYFCHSTFIANTDENDEPSESKDVHLASGMHCVDCHNNGLDHQMIRGYQPQSGEETVNTRRELTCEGCHTGDDDSQPPHAGISGAPHPEHPGIPPVHFEKLSCTTCHSGIWPGEQAALAKTSIAHALGVHGASKSETLLPHIQAPVIMAGTDGKIAPHNMIWPSFWAKMTGDSIIPLRIDELHPLIDSLIVNNDTLHTGNWLDITDRDIFKVLDSLKSGLDSTVAYAFISGGYLYQTGQDSSLVRREHPAAAPYSWPIAHDVRPAQQSLGIRGCNDCHDTDSPFYYSRISVDGPLNVKEAAMVDMIDFQEQNRLAAWVFSFSFLFRPWLKVIIILSVLIILAVVLLYAFRGLAVITQQVESEK